MSNSEKVEKRQNKLFLCEPMMSMFCGIKCCKRQFMNMRKQGEIQATIFSKVVGCKPIFNELNKETD